MKVLVVGSGGREHAIAWALARSPHVPHLWIAPGNGGTAPRNVPIVADDGAGLVAFAREQAADLVVIGPEAPLSAGLSDALAAAGIPAFGPAQAGARLESSKAWAKAFMQRHGIPTPRFAVFDDHAAALRHLLTVDYPVVIKVSGLAAGKGVIVPTCADEAEAALRQVMLDRAFGAAGDTVVIEEKIDGPEVSLLAFVDGEHTVAMPPVQDHKRLLDGDEGPNTGGMGAICPAPDCPPGVVEEIMGRVVRPAVAGLQAEGISYRGVLYAGMMLTAKGPMTLEFNCRFGDPETQCVLPLLETDLFEICMACANGTLDQVPVRWRRGACATVVLASGGYPGSHPKGLPITGVDGLDRQHGVLVFHAGTRRGQDRLLTDGGRVLAVSALGDTLDEALDRAYAGVSGIHFAGMQYRRDIGARARQERRG